ncbi:PH domain-containing protein [Arthrobacter sp. 35W]|uniref:PH domain-containing protein n=1 Tax=Arthrobacter sp. 35W TaxID=1132441 RepID=UPI000408106F|nr:PH domain-containing protein [Arthrobacter sp. 35W]
MATAHTGKPAPVSGEFRPRTSVLLAGFIWLLAAAAAVSTLASGVDGWRGLPFAAALAFIGYWLFWYPVVRLDADAVLLRNPVRRISVPWDALIQVDTKYALTLVTTKGSFAAWAAPAPGALGAFRAKASDAQDLPATSYGAGGSMRPGDLKNSDSGAAAQLVRTHWAALAEAGALNVDATETATATIRYNWALIGAAVVLAVAVAASATI